MINKERDSKFIIYQVLYIFVLTVLALKGADLDLNKVVSTKEAVKKSVRDSLVTIIDSLYAKGINFDIKIKENMEEENTALKQKLASMKVKLTSLTTKLNDLPPEPAKVEKPVKEQTIMQSPLSVTQTFIQYTWNKAKNNGSVPTFIYDPANLNTPLVVIPPGEEKTFDLTNQKEVVVKFGTQEQPVQVMPNKPPQVIIDRVTTKMNSSDIYVKDLQRITAFKVTIIDERPDQLKVTWSGPISVSKPEKDSKGNPVYNVSLNIAPTANRFQEWMDRNKTLQDSDGRYKVNFFFTVFDVKSKDRVQVGDSFYFTDFSR